MDSLDSIRRKMDSAAELDAVVKTMKAMAAGNIGQYETAAQTLNDYYSNIELGIAVYINRVQDHKEANAYADNAERTSVAIVFGSDLGLVGRFNDVLADFCTKSLKTIDGRKEIWAVGKQIEFRFDGSGNEPVKLFSVPNSITAITALVEKVLVDIEQAREKGINEVYLYYNSPGHGTGYEPVEQRLLPLDTRWLHRFRDIKWPTRQLPQMIGDPHHVIAALIREYLFIAIYKACAESLASENASRLEAMQRAQKNIDDILDNLKGDYQKLRQSSIDEELFDVISGFEALKKNKHR